MPQLHRPIRNCQRHLTERQPGHCCKGSISEAKRRRSRCRMTGRRKTRSEKHKRSSRAADQSAATRCAQPLPSRSAREENSPNIRPKPTKTPPRTADSAMRVHQWPEFAHDLLPIQKEQANQRLSQPAQPAAQRLSRKRVSSPSVTRNSSDRLTSTPPCQPCAQTGIEQGCGGHNNAAIARIAGKIGRVILKTVLCKVRRLGLRGSQTSHGLRDRKPSRQAIV